MKKILYALLLASTTLGAASCNKDPKLPTPSVEEFPQIYTNITTQSTYKLADVRATTGNPTAIINLDVRGGDVSNVESIEIYRTARTYNVPATGNPVLAQGGSTVLLRTVPPTSGDVTISINDLIAGMTRPTGTSQTGTRTSITRASLQVNEGFLLTYALLLKSGRRVEYNASFNTAPFSGIVSIVP
jgi:hypothetical protein